MTNFQGAAAAETTPEGLEASFVWDYLSPQLHKEARFIVSALCTLPLIQEGRSGLAERPADSRDFRVLKTGSGKHLRHSVVYIGTKIDVARGEGWGHWDDRRSWDSVLAAEPELFTVDLGDYQLDLRTTQTRDRLRPILRELVPMEREAVLLTGEPPLSEHDVPMIFFNREGGINSVYQTASRKANISLIGFRPAVDLVGQIGGERL